MAAAGIWPEGTGYVLRMHFGMTIFPTEYTMQPQELGPYLEERGFESLWVAEHSHIPASRISPWPGGADLPQMYYDTYDPFMALTAAAAATTTLKLGTGIALVIQRDPIHTAKQVSTLDHLSGGRVLFGVGAGWNIEEMADHGTDPERRFGRMRESIEAMKAIWANDVAEYAGEQISFGPMYQNPKPVQKPHPPIHVGGAFPGAMNRAVHYADGWMPIGARIGDDLPSMLRELDEACAAAGRDRSEIEITMYGANPTPDAIKKLEQQGVDRVIFMPPSDPPDKLRERIDRFAELLPPN